MSRFQDNKGSPWLLFGLVLLGLASAGTFGIKRLDLSVTPFFSPFWKQTFQNLAQTTQDFGLQRTLIVVLQAPPGEDVLSLRMMKLNRSLSKLLKDTTSIRQVISLSESLSLQNEKGALTVKRLLPDDLSFYTPLVQRTLRKNLRLDPLLTGSLVSASQKATLILGLFASDPPSTLVSALLQRIDGLLKTEPSVLFGYEGAPPTAAWMKDHLQNEARWFLPVFLAFLLLALALAVPSFQAVLWGLGLWLASSLLGLSLFALLWGSLPLFALIAPFFLLLLSLPWWIDLALPPPSPLPLPSPSPPVTPASSARLPLFLTTLLLLLLSVCLLLGFFSLQHLLVSSIALSLLASGLLLLLFLRLLPAPLASSSTPTSQTLGTSASSTAAAASETPTAPLLSRFLNLRALQPYRRSLFAALAFLSILLFLASPLLLAGRPLFGYLPSYGPLHTGALLLEEHFGGSTPLLLRFQGPLREPAFLKPIERLGRHLEVTPGVSAPQSYGALIRHLHKLMGTIPRVPDTLEQVQSLAVLMEGQPALALLLRSPNDGLLQARIAAPYLSSAARSYRVPGLHENPLPERLAHLFSSLPSSASLWHPSSPHTRPPRTLLQKRASLITEGIALWVKRHTGHELLLAQKDFLSSLFLRRLQTFAPPPAPLRLAETPLRSALSAYLKSESSDLELSPTEQAKLLQALLAFNQASPWTEASLQAELPKILQGSPAAKDLQSQRYAIRSLLLLASRLQKQDLLETLLSEIDRSFRMMPWWKGHALQKEFLQTSRPSDAILELHGEITEFFSPVWPQTSLGDTRLSTTTTGLQALLWPLASATFNLFFCLSLGLLFLGGFLGFLLLRSFPTTVAALLPSGISTLLFLALFSFFSIRLDITHAFLFLPLLLLSLSFSFRLAFLRSSFLLLSPSALLSLFYHTVFSLLRLTALLLLPLGPLLFSSLPLLREAALLGFFFLPFSLLLTILLFLPSSSTTLPLDA